MKLELAREIVRICKNRDYKQMLLSYYHNEIMLAIRTIDSRKSSTDDDKRFADIVYWKVTLQKDL